MNNVIKVIMLNLLLSSAVVISSSSAVVISSEMSKKEFLKNAAIVVSKVQKELSKIKSVKTELKNREFSVAVTKKASGIWGLLGMSGMKYEATISMFFAEPEETSPILKRVACKNRKFSRTIQDQKQYIERAESLRRLTRELDIVERDVSTFVEEKDIVDSCFAMIAQCCGYSLKED